jgi:hypothetical protein
LTRDLERSDRIPIERKRNCTIGAAGDISQEAIACVAPATVKTLDLRAIVADPDTVSGRAARTQARDGINAVTDEANREI